MRDKNLYSNARKKEGKGRGGNDGAWRGGNAWNPRWKSGPFEKKNRDKPGRVSFLSSLFFFLFPFHEGVERSTRRAPERPSMALNRAIRPPK